MISEVKSSAMSSIYQVASGITSLIPLAITSTVISILTWILAFTEKYVFGDFEFLKFLLVAMIADTCMGGLKYIKEFSRKKFFEGFFLKIVKYCILLIVVHVATHFTINGETVRVFSWLDLFIYSTMIGNELISVVTKGGNVLSKIVPDHILDKISESFKPKKP